MKQIDVVIQNPTGLHARPARVFVDTAKQFRSAVRVRYKEKQVNAKSLISLLTLGVEAGQSISIETDGEDEAQALEILSDLVHSGLGESLLDGSATNGHPAQAPDAPSAAPPMPANTIRGIAGAPGIALGPVFQFRRATIAVQEGAGTPLEERARLTAALAEARTQLGWLYEQTKDRAGVEEAAIFEVHRDLLDDPDLLDNVHTLIDGGQSAAQAWQRATEEQAAALAQLSDPLLAERTTDVRDVGERVLRVLTHAASTAPALPAEPFILIANDLTPSETAALDPARVLGFCTAIGGPNAHTAILARALGLPAVVSAGSAVLELPDHTFAILDGGSGTLTATPDEATLAQAKAAQQALQDRRAAAAAAAAEAAVTSDGHRVEVVANVGGVEDARKAAASGAEGVGLLRTEFLFLQREQPPSEDEQYEVYRDIVTAMQGHPVIVRTLDIGGDKPLPYLNLPAEENPFLGQRGIRLCLAHPDILREQLRAIFRAAAHGPLRIMFPMIADLQELRATRKIVDEIRAASNAPQVEIGIMIEVPAAALMADLFAPEIDFFSIGTNDLTQYTLAMDRTNPLVAAHADGLHPAVLRLIERTVHGAHAAGKWVGVCGELGSDPLAVPILIGLGVDELSVSAPAVPTVKAQIRGLALAECRERARQALHCATAAEVRQGAMHVQV
ncbi:MAG TPA: phosphoenolpyruvate--protein phosphotransferase [Herpetosiphonaceae bacterium]